VTSFGLAKALLVKSVAMPIQNLGAVVRIFAIPMAVYAACLTYTVRLFTSDLTQYPGIEYGEFASLFVRVFLPILAGLFFLVWGVVGWHRYVLNEGPATWLTPVGVRNFLRYVLDSLAITLLMALIAIPVIFILSSVLPAAYTAIVILNPFATLLMFWVFLRLSPLLPSSAIDKRTGLGGAWRATSKGRLALLWVGVVWVVVDQLGTRALGSLALTLTTTESIRVFMAAQMVWMAIFGMWGVSLITTIYGYFVEDRAL
jgi:hypothetical protein